jgi:hypothetical protein
MTTEATEADGREHERRDVSTFALDVFWASGRSGDAVLEAHVASCSPCRGYLASLDALGAGPAPRLAPLPPPVRRRWALPVAATLAMAAAFAVIARPRGAEEPGYVGAKGTPAVQLLVHREHDTHIWDGRAPVHPGDALALRVACEGLRWVTVASPGPSGWARLSESACPGRDEPLPFTLHVNDAPGDEKLAVVLSPRAIDDATMQAAIAEPQRVPDVWVVSMMLPKETETDR